MSLKNFQKTLKWYNTENKVFKNRFGCLYLFTDVCGQDMRALQNKSSDWFEYPKKSLLKSIHPKKYFPKFPSPKKNSPIMPVT